MAWRDAKTLKSYFVTGSLPTEEHFSDLIDSAVGGLVSPLQYGAGGDGVADDTEAWKRLAAFVGEDETWPRGGGERPGRIDLLGRTFLITQDIAFPKNVHLHDGTILLSGATLTLGGRSHALTDVALIHAGRSYYPGALLSIPNGFLVRLSGVYVDAGARSGTARARYGVYIGEERGWGIDISGGRYYGGDIALRIGRKGDHTGIAIRGITADHSRVANVLLCNPASAVLAGCNIEHSDGDGVGLAITSETGGAKNVAHSVVVEGCYFYNIGNGSGGTGPLAPAGVLVGHDLPGSDGFDAPDTPITSKSSAYGISIRNNYLVSERQARAVKVRAAGGVEIADNRWVTADNDIAFDFAGACAASRVIGNRNQNTGEFDRFASRAKQPIELSRRGSWTPGLLGTDVAGAPGYAMRNGDFSIENGLCTITGSIVLGEPDPDTRGALRVGLPFPAPRDRRSGASVVAAGFTGPDGRTAVEGVIFEGTDLLSLRWQGTVLPVQARDASPGASLQFTAVYPVDLAQA